MNIQANYYGIKKRCRIKVKQFRVDFTSLDFQKDVLEYAYNNFRQLDKVCLTFFNGSEKFHINYYFDKKMRFTHEKRMKGNF